LSQQFDEKKKEKQQKRKNQIVFVIASFTALLIVGVIAFFVLSKIKSSKSNEALTQDQFEGTAEISTQLQAECQSSANKLASSKDIVAIEAEFRQNAENCKDVYFAFETDSAFRKEGMYADLVVDIASMLSKTDQGKAIELLKFGRSIKSWDFYLGPVSCDSQHVLDAYIESFSTDEEKQCLKAADLKAKIFPEIMSKNFSFISKLVSKNNVLWVGIPESDVGCPETIELVIQSLKKLAVGQLNVDESQLQNPDGNNLNLAIKLSDKESISLVFTNKNECLELSSVLIPSQEVSE
jgi:hypothetical protein